MNLYSIFALKDNYLKLSSACEAFLYFKNHKIDLITGEKKSSSIDEFEEKLKKIKLDTNSGYIKPIVIHLLYEYSYINLDLKHLLKPDTPLAIFVKYSDVEEKKYKREGFGLNLKSESYPSNNDYQKSYGRGIEYIKQGLTYQFNLTFPFKYKIKDRIQTAKEKAAILESWINSLGVKRGAYAHGTYSSILDKTFLTNSPECLFQIGHVGGEKRVWSVPIKGTEKARGRVSDVWGALKKCAKNQAELFMITDLVLNDLHKFSDLKAKLVRKKLLLKVPGIIHQCSLVSAKLDKNKNLFQLLHCLFPGGSITGAPKLSTVQILAQLENESRGFYCGSTVLACSDILAASINIRSCELDFKNKHAKINAGGGITIKSQVKSEYEEMFLKHDSFIQTIQK